MLLLTKSMMARKQTNGLYHFINKCIRQEHSMFNIKSLCHITNAINMSNQLIYNILLRHMYCCYNGDDVKLYQ